MAVDRDWISFGSANFDPRSFYYNDELDLAWFDPEFALTLENLLLDAFEKSDRIEWSSWRKRPGGKRQCSQSDRVIGRQHRF